MDKRIAPLFCMSNLSVQCWYLISMVMVSRHYSILSSVLIPDSH